MFHLLEGAASRLIAQPESICGTQQEECRSVRADLQMKYIDVTYETFPAAPQWLPCQNVSHHSCPKGTQL